MLAARRRRGAQHRRTATFSPLDVTWTHAFWAEDPGWTPPADGAAVSSWRDAAGGAHATQATGTRQPLYRASAAAMNSRPAIEFDGTNDGLSAAIGMAQPFTIVTVAQMVANRFLFDGTDPRVYMNLRANSLRYRISAGTTLDSAVSGDSARHFLVGVYNGASSSIHLDGTQIASGNAGTNAMTSPVYFGCERAFTSGQSLGGVMAFRGIKSGTLSSGDLAALLAWSQSLYGTP